MSPFLCCFLLNYPCGCFVLDPLRCSLIRFYIENCLSVNNISLCWKTQLIEVFSEIMALPGKPKAPAKTCAVDIPFSHPLNTFHPSKLPHSLDLKSCGFCHPESHKDTDGYWDWDRCQAWNASALIPPVQDHCSPEDVQHCSHCSEQIHANLAFWPQMMWPEDLATFCHICHFEHTLRASRMPLLTNSIWACKTTTILRFP